MARGEERCKRSAAAVKSMARSLADRRKGADELRRQKAEGMAYARAWKERHKHLDWAAIAAAEAG